MRRRILFLVVGMTTLVVLSFAIPLAILIRHNAYNSALSNLRRDTSGLTFDLLRYNTTLTDSEIETAISRFDGNRDVSVQLPTGNLLGTAPPGGLAALPPLRDDATRPFDRGAPSAPSSGSASGPETPTSGPTPGPNLGSRTAPFGNGAGPAPVAYRGGQLTQVKVPTRTTGQYTVRIWESESDLHSGQTAPLLLLVGVAIALLAIGVGAGEILTRRIVRPLVDTAGTAQRLSSGDTTARAPTDGPREVADVGLALNRLADRIDQLIAEERETVADLSHRLRTPMTALRLEAEALRNPGDAERIGGHVTALERMLTAVIRAARRPQREGRLPSCDATAVVGERVEFWSALAEDQGRTVTVDLPDVPLPVRAGAEDLAAAVDALLENVFAHTPEGAAFTVRLAATGADALLTIADDGPGLPVDAEIRGRSDRGSTGLGLDIARRCAESSGGGMTLGSSASGGALITLDLRGA